MSPLGPCLCPHRDLPLILLQLQGVVGHLDGDHLGRTDFFAVARDRIFLQYCELLQAGPGPAGLNQHIHTGADEVKAAAVESGVMGSSGYTAGGRVHSHTPQDATGHLTDFIWAAIRGLTGHQAALVTVAKRIALGSRIEVLFCLVVNALVHAATGGQGYTSLTTKDKAFVTDTGLLAM